MSLSASTVWEVRTTGASTAGGGFNVGNANFPADLAATVATSTAPVVTSASYTFVAGDVGALVFIKSGTNWTPGWYAITSVSAGAATLSAAIGAVSLYGGATLLSMVAGCATVASPTGGTWAVDYSQQAAAQFAFTDLVIGATTTQFTSAAFPVGKHMVGNLINVVSGTGFTVQRVEVVSTSGTTATCDKSLGTTASTGGTGNLGGCLDGFGTLSGPMVASNKAFVKTTAGYTSTASITFAQTVAASSTAPRSSLIGYTTTRGDAGVATLTLNTNSGLTALIMSGNGWYLKNLAIDCNSLATSTGINLSGTNGAISNVKVSRFSTIGIKLTNNGWLIIDSEITGGTAGSAISGAGIVRVEGCNIHDNVAAGVVLGGNNSAVVHCLISNNSGAASNGITVAGNSTIFGNTVYASGQHGIAEDSTDAMMTNIIRKNILASNGGYGIAGSITGAGTAAMPDYDGNAYWNNTSGTRNNMDGLGATNAQNGAAPYVNTLDVILTVDPFVAKASDDYRLNATAGGGAACRGFGVPTSWPGNTLTTSAPDMGAAQHTDSSTPGQIMVVKGQTVISY